MDSNHAVKTRRKFDSVWGELEYVCAKVHNLWYVKRHPASAKRYLERLERILAELPKGNRAILREEGLALMHELKGDIAQAIRHRKREIELMRRLYKDVRSHAYSTAVKDSILVNRGRDVLRERLAIVDALECQKKPTSGQLRRRA